VFARALQMEKKEIDKRLDAMGDMPSVHSSYEALKRESETEELSNFEYWDPTISKTEEKDFKKHERMTGL
jgi:hypothetical protein